MLNSTLRSLGNYGQLVDEIAPIVVDDFRRLVALDLLEDFPAVLYEWPNQIHRLHISNFDGLNLIRSQCLPKIKYNATEQCLSNKKQEEAAFGIKSMIN